MYKLLKSIEIFDFFFYRKKIPWILTTVFTAIILSLRNYFPVQAQTSSAVPNLQLHHATLLVDDVDMMSQWYANTLGFAINDRFTLDSSEVGLIDVARVEIPSLRMNISHVDGTVPPDPDTTYESWRQIVFEVDDVDADYELLRSKGVEFMTEPFNYDPPGFRLAYFKDPEGNILEIYKDL